MCLVCGSEYDKRGAARHERTEKHNRRLKYSFDADGACVSREAAIAAAEAAGDAAAARGFASVVVEITTVEPTYFDTLD